MALRITNKEKEYLRKINQKAQRKSRRLYQTYGMPSMKFQTRKISSFTTRAELNAYKKQIENYTSLRTHRYIPGGVVGDTPYAFPIPIEEAWEIRRILRKRNQSIKRFKEKYDKTKTDIKGRPQANILKNRLESYYIYKDRLTYPKIGYNPHLKFNPKQIHTRRSLDKYKYSIKKFHSQEGLEEKKRRAHFNYQVALLNTFGETARDLVEVIKNMTTNDFIAFFESDPFAEFYYIYDPVEAEQLLKNLSNHLLNFATNRHLKIDRKSIRHLLELNNQDIFAQYGIGEREGKRIYLNIHNEVINNADLVEYFKSAKLNYDPETGEDRLTLYYVDLDPMEWVMFQAYNDLDVIPGWQGRRKQLATEYHHGQRKKK